MNPKRKRFQVHLSTAVVLMFAAGGMIWLNVTDRWQGFHSLYGWPLVAMEAWHSTILDGTQRNLLIGSIALDALTALAILFAVWFVCERWIAWRAGRKKG